MRLQARRSISSAGIASMSKSAATASRRLCESMSLRTWLSRCGARTSAIAFCAQMSQPSFGGSASPSSTASPFSLSESMKSESTRESGPPAGRPRPPSAQPVAKRTRSRPSVCTPSSDSRGLPPTSSCSRHVAHRPMLAGRRLRPALRRSSLQIAASREAVGSSRRRREAGSSSSSSSRAADIVRLRGGAADCGRALEALRVGFASRE